MHPGWSDTPGVATALPGFRDRMGDALRSQAQGADTIVWLAAAPEAAVVTGRFWFDRAPVREDLWGAGTAVDAAQEAALWSLCEALVGGSIEAATERSGEGVAASVTGSAAPEAVATTAASAAGAADGATTDSAAPAPAIVDPAAVAAPSTATA
jgi:hypothetical protein